MLTTIDKYIKNFVQLRNYLYKLGSAFWKSEIVFVLNTQREFKAKRLIACGMNHTKALVN
jgi:hypothetical protein